MLVLLLCTVVFVLGISLVYTHYLYSTSTPMIRAAFFFTAKSIPLKFFVKNLDFKGLFCASILKLYLSLTTH